MSKFYVGIDFGTTNTSIAYMAYRSSINDYVPENFNLFSSGYTCKTVIGYYNEKDYCIGDIAVRNSTDKCKDNFIKSIKRHIIEGNKIELSVQKTYKDIVADYLRAIKEEISRKIPVGKTIDGVVMGVPIGFEEKNKNLFLQALHEAGYYNSLEDAEKNTVFVSEPIAALLDYNESLNKDQTAMVFDFGGGTMDIVVMDLKNISNRNEIEPHEVLAKGGCQTIGGDDIDKAILEDIVVDKIGGVKKLKEALSINLLEDIYKSPDGIGLMDLIRNTKEELSKTKLSYINGYIGNKHIDIEITRDELEVILKRKFVPRIITEIDKVLSDANDGYGINPQKIDIVVMAGGSSLIPCIQRALEEKFGYKKVKIHEDAVTTISRGLAIRGHDYDKSKFNDIIEHEYSIKITEADGTKDVIEPVIPKNSKIKVINGGKYKTPFAIKEEVINKNIFSIEIYEDDKRVGKAVIPINSVHIMDNCFELKFVIDENLERIEIKVNQKSTGKELLIPIENRYVTIRKLL